MNDQSWHKIDLYPIGWALFCKSCPSLSVAIPQLYGYICRSYAKFEVTEATRGQAKHLQNLGLTVVEAENPRSSNHPNMGIYGLHLTHWFQNMQKYQNWTKIDELLLINQPLFSGYQNYWPPYACSKTFSIFVWFRHFLPFWNQWVKWRP